MTPARTVGLGNGRTLAYLEWGDPNGSPILECHGNPGCRVLVWDEAVAARLGVRLITVDRPGIGSRARCRGEGSLTGPTMLVSCVCHRGRALRPARILGRRRLRVRVRRAARQPCRVDGAGRLDRAARSPGCGRRAGTTPPVEAGPRPPGARWRRLRAPGAPWAFAPVGASPFGGGEAACPATARRSTTTRASSSVAPRWRPRRSARGRAGWSTTCGWRCIPRHGGDYRADDRVAGRSGWLDPRRRVGTAPHARSPGRSYCFVAARAIC